MSIEKHRVIRTSIQLPPEQMSMEWKKNLTEAVEKSLVGKCIKEYGYVMRIDKFMKIVDQQITRLDGNIRFHLDIQVTSILPVIGEKIEAVIEMIFPHGVFCSHHAMRMMLPINRCAEYTLRHEFSTISLYRPSDGHVLRKTDCIPVVIEDIRFENDLYSCIVSMVEEEGKNEMK